MSPKDPSNEELLDQARHEDIIEREERIRREHPELVRKNAELEAKVKLLEGRSKRSEQEVRNVEYINKILREEQARLQDEIFRLSARPESVGRPLPIPQTPQRKQVTLFTPAVCRDCHQRILWGTTKNGRNIPLNPKPVVGEMVEWSRELEAQLLERGIEMKRGYDELGDQVTVAVVPDPNPLIARVLYPVHFQSCTARNISSTGGSRTT